MRRRLAAITLVLLLAACDSKPSDVREWQATDHDHTTEPSPTGPAEAQARQAPARPKIPGVGDLTLTAWKNQCVPCHGPMGRGDGPMGPSLEVPNLTSATTRSLSDDEVIALIESGRGKMPGFDLPRETRTELVRLIRLFGGAPPHAPNASGAPAGSAAPDSSAASPAPSASR